MSIVYVLMGMFKMFMIMKQKQALKKLVIKNIFLLIPLSEYMDNLIQNKRELTMRLN